jgi:hypothetical protein
MLWVFEVDVATIKVTPVTPVVRTHVVGAVLPKKEILPTTVHVPEIAIGLTRSRLIANAVDSGRHSGETQDHA